MATRADTISIPKMKRSCERVGKILKSLSHPRRLLVLGHLLNGAKTVGELVELCEVSQSQMSHFLAHMASEGLVECKRDGKFRVYSVADRRLVHLLKTLQREYC